VVGESLKRMAVTFAMSKVTDRPRAVARMKRGAGGASKVLVRFSRLLHVPLAALKKQAEAHTSRVMQNSP
jgi:hypothetical protein